MQGGGGGAGRRCREEEEEQGEGAALSQMFDVRPHQETKQSEECNVKPRLGPVRRSARPDARPRVQTFINDYLSLAIRFKPTITDV